MGNRIKTLIFMCLFIFLFMFVSCARRPIVLEDVYSKTNIDFNIYKRLAVIEFTPNIRVKKNKTITEIFEDEFQKQGYGSLLLKKALERINRIKGVKRIILNVKTSNVSAIDLYKKFNFRIVGKIEQYYRQKESAYLMELKI